MLGSPICLLNYMCCWLILLSDLWAPGWGEPQFPPCSLLLRHVLGLASLSQVWFSRRYTLACSLSTWCNSHHQFMHVYNGTGLLLFFCWLFLCCLVFAVGCFCGFVSTGLPYVSPMFDLLLYCNDSSKFALMAFWCVGFVVGRGPFLFCCFWPQLFACQFMVDVNWF